MFNINYVPPQGPPPYRVRIEAIGDAWNMVLSDVGPWAVGILILIGTMIVLELTFFGIFMNMMAPAMQSGPALTFPPVGALVAIFVFVVAVSIPMNLLTASMQRIGLLKLRGHPVTTGDLFKLDGASGHIVLWTVGMLVAALIIEGVLGGLVVGVAFLIRPNPALAAVGVGLAILGYLVFLVAAVFLQTIIVFVPLIIMDQRLAPLDALKLSYRTFKRHALMVFVVMLLGGIVSEVGIFACGIGFIITGGISFAVIPIMYNDFFRPIPLQPQTETPGTFGL